MFDYDTETGEIWLFDVIGPEWAGMINEASILQALRDMGGRDIDIRINSPGGDVTAASAIYNAIQRYSGFVTTHVEALAASAASYVMLAGDAVIAAENSMIMIHSPWTMVTGNANDLRATAEVLDKFEVGMVAMYEKKTKKPRDEIKAKLDAETWMTAQEALDWGLVDSLASETQEEAIVPQGMFQNTPAALLKSGNEVKPGSLSNRNLTLSRQRLRIAKAK